MKNNGFTLFELAIALVVIGLIVGSILGGQSLIRMSELRSVGTDKEKLVTVVHAFTEYYRELPGDFTKATKVWGAANAVPATCRTTQATGNLTCDGDGDGFIKDVVGVSNEQFRAMQQLANAGMIDGRYTGVSGPNGSDHSIMGVNVPGSKMSGTGFFLRWMDNAGNATRYATTFNNAFDFGGSHNTTAPISAVLTPEEAWSIDSKLDDGKPAQGSVIARYWNNACAVADDGTSAANDLVASYKLTDKTKQCALIFKSGL